jgi:heavy metal sensor kinase
MLSLRVKLTLYYLAILTAVLVFFGFAIYDYLSRSLESIIDKSLAYQAAAIERQLTAGTLGDFQTEVHPGAPDTELPIDELAISPAVIQLIDAQGRVVDEPSPSPVHDLPIDLAQLNQIRHGETHFETITLKSGEQFRLVTRCAKDPVDGDTYFIRLGQSLAPLQKARRHLLLLLGIAIPVALLLGSYGGLLLANQALSPVDRITRAAEQIGAGDLSERVPLPDKMDEIGRLAATFNHMIGRLQAAFERQRQFTSDASHELRTPLAVMRGDIEITLRRKRTPEEYERTLTSNLEEIIRLSRLVEDLLTLARADAGQAALRCEPIELDKLCQQMAEYIMPLVQMHEQTLDYEPPAAPVRVKADAQRLKQLLLNLLDNAIKYTGHGGRITLGLKVEGREAVLTVADTGRGIPPEDLPHLFERFFRHTRSTSDKVVTGFGLGLSIVKWIVDAHGGKIEATSKVGEGTTFTVRLPLLGA